MSYCGHIYLLTSQGCKSRDLGFRLIVTIHCPLPSVTFTEDQREAYVQPSGPVRPVMEIDLGGAIALVTATKLRNPIEAHPEEAECLRTPD